jgi:hypothetical protein
MVDLAEIQAAYYMVPPWKIPYLLGSLIIVFGAVFLLDRMKLIEKLTPEE